jgi:hypothetical protein
MDNRALRKLIKKHMLPDFPGFVLSSRESDLFAVPMNHLYRSFMFCGSSYSTTTFRVNAAVVPLYVPTEFYHVDFGGRLQNGNDDVWEWSEAREEQVMAGVKEAMLTQGLPRLSKIQSPLDFARVIPALEPQKTVNRTEAVAYSLIYSEQFAEAEPLLKELCDELDRLTGNSTVGWAVEKRRRNHELHRALRQDPQKAGALLLEWEQRTIKNLKLEKYPN